MLLYSSYKKRLHTPDKMPGCCDEKNKTLTKLMVVNHAIAPSMCKVQKLNEKQLNFFNIEKKKKVTVTWLHYLHLHLGMWLCSE